MSGETRRPWSIEVTIFLFRKMRLLKLLLSSLALRDGLMLVKPCKRSLNFLVEQVNNVDRGIL